ncbi:MAG TPA: metalloregulator ArsR/SmtB family transcription factor [Candidatus Dormibacteraeota bacterium]|jgi:ArsR family transcriptional regulator|nr:metalloregulator ArsR/SmtB family transcription factor [Candidatus Dormibacteraeota bacterium]
MPTATRTTAAATGTRSAAHSGRTFEELPVRTRGCCSDVAAPLPEARADDIAGVMRALADPTRVQMVHMLKAATEPICVCDFNAVFHVGQPTVSHHLAKLRDAGLVESEKLGIWAFYRLRGDLSPAAKQAVALIP